MRDFTPSCPEPDLGRAPLRMGRQTVRPDWIDYNGHMNVAYYTKAFDEAFDDFLENFVGIGESFVARARMGPMALQSQYCYLGELLEGEAFHVDVRVIDADAKRMHVFGEMLAEADGRLAATFEGLSMNVDLAARKSAPYPDFALARLTDIVRASAALPAPPTLGQPIGIRRRG